MITFDEKQHKYFDGEKELISVTTLMRKHGLAPDYSAVRSEVLEAKAERGTLIHKEIEDFIKNGEIGFTQEVSQFADYVIENEVKVEGSEITFNNDIVAGTCDLIIKYKGDMLPVIADIKTTSTLHKEAVSWQLSIYAYLSGLELNEKYGQAFHFDKESNLKVVDIPLKPREEVERLMEAERKGERYIQPVIALEESQIATIKEASEAIKRAKAEQEQAEERLAEIKDAILSAMEQNGVKSFENDYFKVTYIDPVERTTIDTARLKKELPNVARDFEKKTLQKASVRITLKGEQK